MLKSILKNITAIQTPMSLQIHYTFHTAGLTVTSYELISYLEPLATNILYFNADKVLSTTLFEQRVFCQKSNCL